MVQGHSSFIIPNDCKNVLLIKNQCSTEIQIWSILILQWYVLIYHLACITGNPRSAVFSHQLSLGF